MGLGMGMGMGSSGGPSPIPSGIYVVCTFVCGGGRGIGSYMAGPARSTRNVHGCWRRVCDNIHLDGFKVKSHTTIRHALWLAR
jgi:hypothetical protein